MSTPKPFISLSVDVTNPGQYFACCGLLELAHRMPLWHEVEGWFASRIFSIRAHTDVEPGWRNILDLVLTGTITANAVGADDALRPIHIEPCGITLDWWVDLRGRKTPLKLWAGQQTSRGIVLALQDAIKGVVHTSPDALFDASQPLTGRFGVDPRAAWNTLDVGFSPNEQQMEVVTFPVVELVAAIGLQGFRPRQHDDDSFRYATWSEPLPVPIARAACAGCLSAGIVRHFSFRVATRGSYKGFDYASPIGGEL